MNYTETLDFLFKQLPMYQRDGSAAFKKTLNNILKISELLGQPEKGFKSIHIAGTNGKGSTAHMLASIFQAAGYKTGLYTSPHLKDFRERIKINGTEISEEKVISFVENHHEIFNSIKPSFFEWTVALAFQYFNEEKVDIAIIETGMGGRLDSTNIIKPELSIITNIGLDHTQFLGNTKELIAKEKAGIIKENTPVVIGNSSGQKEVFNSVAKEKKSSIIYAEDIEVPKDLATDLKGNYQKENLRTVYVSWLELRKLGFKISYPQLKEGTEHTQTSTGLKGRWQVLQENPKVVLETAHNEDGLRIALNQVKDETFKQLHMVLGFVNDKDLRNILNLFPKDANYYFCKANIPRAMDEKKLQSIAKDYKLEGSSYITVDEAFKSALMSAEKEDLIYVGGSNFVVAEIV